MATATTSTTHERIERAYEACSEYALILSRRLPHGPTRKGLQMLRLLWRDAESMVDRCDDRIRAMRHEAADRMLAAFQAGAVSVALNDWLGNRSEDDKEWLDGIVRSSGYARRMNWRKDGRADYEWCGMAAVVWWLEVGLDQDHRKLYHTRNVEDFFRYEPSHRVHGRLKNDPFGDGSVQTWHRESCEIYGEAAKRQWAVAPVQARPGDMALIDHQADGKADHIVLVACYYPEDGTLITVEGNASGLMAGDRKWENPLNGGELISHGQPVRRDSVTMKVRHIDDPQIYGIGRPSLLDFFDHEYE